MKNDAAAAKEPVYPAQRHRIHRFGKSLKIKKSREVGAALQGGQQYTCRYFKIFYLRNGLNRSRYAFIITPRAMGSAVARNRVRRVMRELVRKESCSGLHLDIIFMLNNFSESVNAETFKRMIAEWNDTLKK